MEINWSNVSDEELCAVMASVHAELEARDNAKARKLTNAIDKTIREFLAEYPSACWMIEIEDDDGFTREINLFDYELDTNLIMP